MCVCTVGVYSESLQAVEAKHCDVRNMESSCITCCKLARHPLCNWWHAVHPFLLETFPSELQHLPLVFEATFRRPLYMPSSVKVSFCQSGPALQLNVANAQDESDLHVEATLQHMA